MKLFRKKRKVVYIVINKETNTVSSVFEDLTSAQLYMSEFETYSKKEKAFNGERYRLVVQELQTW